jgi:hypothetical protein
MDLATVPVRRPGQTASAALHSARGLGRGFGWQGARVAVTAAALVERFYDVVWNKADEQAAREILHPDFIFRASLGPELRGPEGFIAYLRSVHAALEHFTCIIEDLVATDERAAAKMRFTGTHPPIARNSSALRPPGAPSPGAGLRSSPHATA